MLFRSVVLVVVLVFSVSFLVLVLVSSRRVRLLALHTCSEYSLGG
jgi:uncharacterized membrane protein